MNQRETMVRRLPVGAELRQAGGTHFRVWAPRRRTVELILIDAGRKRTFALQAEGDGYFSAHVDEAPAGCLYRYRLDGGQAYPDPASRYQPEGPHGPSQVVDACAFRWSDAQWGGVEVADLVVYEMHVGTFTPEGTWGSAARELPRLASDGITAVELMPAADFCGRFGWGYDGVDLFAPTRLYGTPDDLRRFVDTAHGCGLAVVLDVVYNHLGPDGNYLREFSPAYFTQRYDNEWGDAINFDGPDSAPVREFFLANAGYWIDEFHLDGLRLDATQQMFDASPAHIIGEIVRRVREAGMGRTTLVIAENEPQDARLVRGPGAGGHGLDAAWNDDFHHSARVAATGRREAYYSDYLGSPQELVSAAKYGYLYQGQHYSWQNKRRGAPALDIAPDRLVHYLQNHDQVANSAHGLRLHRLTTPGRYRALTAILLLGPAIPMLFQGQEFAASSPFHFFADHEPRLAAAVRKGRAEFMSQFPGVATMLDELPDPGDPALFERCKLDPGERERHAEAHALHRDLLRLRREQPALRRRERIDGAVLGPEAFVLRFFHADGDRLLVVNLGTELRLVHAPEPLLGPPPAPGNPAERKRWKALWSSEDPRYGGSGTPALEGEAGWRIPGHSAALLMPEATA